VRVFAACPLPAGVSAGIAGSFSSARALAPRVKWVGPESMHLTLHFFGEIPDQEIKGFTQVFEDPALRIPAPRARLGPAGCFPAAGTPRVLWVGLRDGVEALRAFWVDFTEKLHPLRRPGGPLRDWCPDVRGFNPHVTVARSGTVPLDARWAAAPVPSADFEIVECVLFQSLLGAGGARYVRLMSIPFQKGNM
jgi:2'-5' RNA ligase